LRHSRTRTPGLAGQIRERTRRIWRAIHERTRRVSSGCAYAQTADLAQTIHARTHGVAERLPPTIHEGARLASPDYSWTHTVTQRVTHWAAPRRARGLPQPGRGGRGTWGRPRRRAFAASARRS